MTEKEAIEILQEEHDYAQLKSYVNAAIDIAISAIEKQVPKKPKKIKNEIVCPTCGTLIGSNPYCKYCGQAIDWGDSIEGRREPQEVNE